MRPVNPSQTPLNRFTLRSLWALVALFTVVGLIGLIVVRHVLPTGFDQQTTDLKPNQYYRPAKTLWDWLQLAGIPVALAFIAYLFQNASKKSDQRIALENQRNDILQKYVDAMSELILSAQWEEAVAEYRKSRKQTKPQIVARARTQVALSALQSEPPDSRRRGQIVRFLLENQLLQQADLISPAVIELYGTDLRGIDLAKADLSKVDLRGVDLTGADLRWANLRDILENLVDTEHRYRGSEPYTTKLDTKWQLVTDILNRWKLGRDLTSKDLRDAYLNGVDLSHSKLRHADFRGANLAAARIHNSDLRGANFRGAALELADLGWTRIDWRTRFDPKWKLVWRIRCQEKRRDVLIRSLGNADLAHAYLFYASMSEAVLENADLSNADFEGATLDGAKFSGKTKLLGTKFANAHLERCHFDDCYIMGCNLKEAKLNDAYLIGAHCSISQLDGADLTGAHLNGAEFWSVTLIGAILAKADFTGATFKDVDCTDANLRDATISREQLSTISNLSGAILPDGSRHP